MQPLLPDEREETGRFDAVEVYAHPEVCLQKARIREMALDDLPQVMRIEFAVFDQPWSPLAFALELSSNPNALYLVLTDDELSGAGKTTSAREADRDGKSDGVHKSDGAYRSDGAGRSDGACKTDEGARADRARIIGYIGLWKTLDEVWITRIAVDPSHMRQGWGSCLLRQAQTQAETWGLGTIALEVRESNSRACALYLSEGYEQVEILYDYYSLPQENARVFMKRLGKHQTRSCLVRKSGKRH